MNIIRIMILMGVTFTLAGTVNAVPITAKDQTGDTHFLDLDLDFLPDGFETQGAIVRQNWPGLYVFSRDGRVVVANPDSDDGDGSAWRLVTVLKYQPEHTTGVEDILMYNRRTYISKPIEYIGRKSQYAIFVLDTASGRVLGSQRFPRRVTFNGYGNIAFAIVDEDAVGDRLVYELNSFYNYTQPQHGSFVDLLDPKVVHTRHIVTRICARFTGFF